MESEWLFALRNALVVVRLQQLAMRDTLTGLGNRRFFDDVINSCTQLAKRNNSNIALLLLDLDNFKQANDNAGHAAGDEVLLAVANTLRNTLRASDQMFRFGGDEFAVLLIDQEADSAELVARRVVKAINQHHICQEYQVSVSAGLAILKPEQDKMQLFNAADNALYQAKNAGKSTVRVA
mgnify:FL=1